MRALALFACATVSGAAMQVLVTGAGGRTGSLVFSQLKHEPNTIRSNPRLARSKRALKALRKAGATREEIIRADATQSKESLVSAMRGARAWCCARRRCRHRPLSRQALFTKYVRAFGGRAARVRPRGGTPEEVDWLGASSRSTRRSRRASSASCSSRRGRVAQREGQVVSGKLEFSRPENFLNTIGRRPDGTGGRVRVEAQRSGAPTEWGSRYHHPPGRPVDEPPSARAPSSASIRAANSTGRARADVARVCCAALVEPAAANAFRPREPRSRRRHADARRALRVCTLGARTCDYAGAATPVRLAGRPVRRLIAAFR